MEMSQWTSRMKKGTTSAFSDPEGYNCLLWVWAGKIQLKNDSNAQHCKSPGEVAVAKRHTDESLAKFISGLTDGLLAV